MLPASNNHYFPVAYYYIRSEPCFVHLLFQRKSKDPRDLDSLFSPVLADDYAIQDFQKINNLDSVVFLPEDHSARGFLRSLNDKCPLAIRFSQEEICISKDASDLVDVLTASEKSMARNNPFFGLGLARLIADTELEYTSATSAYEFISENIPGLEKKWAEETVLSRATRNRFRNYLHCIGDESPSTEASKGEKSIFRIVVCALGAANFVEQRVYERDNIIFRIEFNEMGLEYIENSDDLIAVVGRPGLFSVPHPFIAHPGKFFFSIAIAGEETIGQGITLPAREKVWQLSTSTEPLDAMLDSKLRDAVDFFYPAMWPSVSLESSR